MQSAWLIDSIYRNSRAPCRLQCLFCSLVGHSFGRNLTDSVTCRGESRVRNLRLVMMHNNSHWKKNDGFVLGSAGSGWPAIFRHWSHHQIEFQQIPSSNLKYAPGNFAIGPVSFAQIRIDMMVSSFVVVEGQVFSKTLFRQSQAVGLTDDTNMYVCPFSCSVVSVLKITYSCDHKPNIFPETVV